jgi:hypothetical protein
MKRLTILYAAVVLSGCQDSSPTGIVSRSAPAGGASHTVVNADPQNARVAIDDAVDRIVPALSDAGAAHQIGAALKGLQQALQAGDALEAPALASVVSSAVERYASLANGDAAEVDAIRLALVVLLNN